jgi:uncharacterized protein (TIGR04255 family)
MALTNLEYKGKKFSKAPLVEAIFEVRYPLNLSVDTKKDVFFNSIKDIFPNINTPEPLPFEHHIIEPMAYYSVDGTENLSCSVSKLSYITRSYQTFHGFKERVIKYSGILDKVCGVNKVNRIGLRYINHIQIAKEGEGIPINKYLKFNFNLPESIPKNNIIDFQTLLVTKFEKGSVRSIFATSKKSDKDILILDNDVIISGEYNTNEIDKILTEAHDKVETVFLDTLNSEYLKNII